MDPKPMALRIQALVGLRISRNRVPGVCHPQAATYITLVRPPHSIIDLFSGPFWTYSGDST